MPKAMFLEWKKNLKSNTSFKRWQIVFMKAIPALSIMEEEITVGILSSAYIWQLTDQTGY